MVAARPAETTRGRSPRRTPADYLQRRVAHWDAVARAAEGGVGWGAVYHRRLAEIYRSVIAPGQRVLEIGCGTGDLLAALEPRTGVGVDISPEMLRIAAGRHPRLRFIQADALALPFRET